MQKEIFTREEVRAILTEAVKIARNRTQKPRKADTQRERGKWRKSIGWLW